LQDILKITSSSIHIALDELNKIGIDIPNYTINYVANDVLFNSVGVSQALERRNQTLIINYSDPYFYEDSDSLKFVATTQRILLHEMLHVFMPLAFKDSLLEPFRYNEKIMSGHLWLYEGFIEYQTVKLMFINNLITQTEFLDRLNNMIYSYIPYEKMGRFISLYKLSIDAFNETSLQLLFYNRAAILCFYADMLIYQRTNGEKDFWSILTEIYKENPVFNPDSLNNYLVQHTFPEFRSFIDTYIVGTKYLNPKSFEQFGLNYTLIKPDISTKHIPIQIQSSKNRISDIAIRKYGSTLSNKEKLVSLVSINNLPISTYSISSVYSLIPRDYIQIICIENGIEKRDSLKTLPVILPKVPTFPSLTINEKDDFFERFIGN
jgi:predicted metalloprotease with PDZ domain